MEINVRWNRRRKFGIEFEVNRSGMNKSDIAAAIRSIPGQQASCMGYGHSTNNTEWHVKDDASCGYEAVTPVLSGPNDLKMACDALQAIQARGFNCDSSCGGHIHINVADYSLEQLKVLLMWWIKIERFVLNTHPMHRRINSFCKPVNGMVTVRPNTTYTPDQVWTDFKAHGGNGRYCALNTLVFQPGSTSSRIEFRFPDMTYDLEVVKNRVRFLIWFVDLCKNLPAPSDLNWFTPKTALRFFGLMDSTSPAIVKTFSPAVLSMRQWLLDSFERNAGSDFRRDVDSVRGMKEELVRLSSSEEAANEAIAAAQVSGTSVSAATERNVEVVPTGGFVPYVRG